MVLKPSAIVEEDEECHNVSMDVTSKREVESIAGHPTDTEVRKK